LLATLRILAKAIQDTKEPFDASLVLKYPPCMSEEILKFHDLAVDEVLKRLETSREGLSASDAKNRLERFGPNRLEQGKKDNPLLRFLSQFNDILIYVLLASAIGTAYLGQWIDTAVILGVVVINAFIGFIQEGRAEKALEAVKGMLSAESRVLRDGRKMTIPSERLVPGDVVLLSAGDRVPADLRLFKERRLEVNESSLTGESETVRKKTAPVEEDAPLGDRTCMAFSGTIVTSGTGRGVVTATGGNTEIGHINRMLADVESTTTPLLKQVNRFGFALSATILVLAVAVFALGSFLTDMLLENLFLSVVAISVAAIPEGLPAVLSIILAIGVRRMAGKNAIIRRLPSVETLGSVAVICTDKTGTLTKGEMTVGRLLLAEGSVNVEGVGYSPEGALIFAESGERAGPEGSEALRWLVTACELCNEARLYQEDEVWKIDGEPTEGALLTLAAKTGMDYEKIARQWTRLDAIPFDSDYKFMATLNQSGEYRKIFVKGAPEAVLPKCNRQMKDDGTMEKVNLSLWEEKGQELAGEGFRLLAVAVSTPPEEQDSLEFDDLKEGLTLLGLVAIMDPPRPEAVEAVEECRRAGIKVKMITGDHARTAGAIAKRMGIGNGGRVVTGPEIEKATDKELMDLVDDVDVFARVSPEHKLRLVGALQSRGNVTAMTGDGVNDAPALKKADIGVSMGEKGTEAAKEAADMVLADDNFASIVHAVEEGRTVYDNLKKTLLFLLPTNGGMGLVIMTAIVSGFFSPETFVLPITPVQVLWVNMVSAVTLALALAFEPMEAGVMEKPPRPPEEPLVSRLMLIRIVYVSVLLMAAAFGVFHWYSAQGSSMELARTMAVNTLIVGEIAYLFNSRYMEKPALSKEGFRATPQVWGAAAAVILFQMPFTYLPFMQGIFKTASLGVTEWFRMLGVGAAVFLVVEAEKALVRRMGFGTGGKASSR
jgi:magnesium-transporting ATPase (P-type)